MADPLFNPPSADLPPGAGESSPGSDSHLDEVDESVPITIEEPEPLNQIVDDYEPRLEAVDLTIKALNAGDSFESAKAYLVEIGWGDADADDIVEEARIRTQHSRGIVTRDQVVQNVNRRYRQSMVWAAAIRLIHSLGSLASLRWVRRNTDEDVDMGG